MPEPHGSEPAGPQPGPADDDRSEPSATRDPHRQQRAGRLEGLAQLDLERGSRRGTPEAVLCDAKSPAQVSAIAAEYARLDREGAKDVGPILFTRADGARAQAVLEALPQAAHHEQARLLAWPPQPPEPTGGLVIVACAGTSDLPMAREALETARYLGRPVRLIADIGIAGQIAAPVVALPTSVGYGVAAGGHTAALTMLSACAPGIGVVNIDNGYGAGHLAAQIARWATAPDQQEATEPPPR